MTTMEIGVPAEKGPGERRVALTPSAVGRLAESGQRSSSRKEPGSAAGFPDSGYRAAGAEIVDRKTALSRPW